VSASVSHVESMRSAGRATLFICDTCHYRPGERWHEGRTGGVIFAEHVERRARELRLADLVLLRTSCLMACTRHCTVHLRAPAKIGYVIGGFEPTEGSAAVLLDYVRKYQESETGQVPYSTWPAGIKGHFIARTPPYNQGNPT
jgi:predicted metal-binding protein